jgi:hypothetical protein
LWSATLTDRGLESIAALANLEELNIRGAKLTNAGTAPLVKLNKLRVLDLGQTPLSASGLGPLADLPALRQLSLYQCERVSDDAIALLSRLAAIEFLDLEGTSITAAGLERLKAALPRARIVR